MASNKKPLPQLPNKSSPAVKTDTKRSRTQPDSQTTICNTKGGYIVKTVEKGKSKPNMNSNVPDISNLLKMALKAHSRQKNPSQRFPSESTPDTSDSDEW